MLTYLLALHIRPKPTAAPGATASGPNATNKMQFNSNSPDRSGAECYKLPFPLCRGWCRYPSPSQPIARQPTSSPWEDRQVVEWWIPYYPIHRQSRIASQQGDIDSDRVNGRHSPLDVQEHTSSQREAPHRQYPTHFNFLHTKLTLVSTTSSNAQSLKYLPSLGWCRFYNHTRGSRSGHP